MKTFALIVCIISTNANEYCVNADHDLSSSDCLAAMTEWQDAKNESGNLIVQCIPE